VATRDNITNSLADVLSRGSSMFIKSYGRGTLSTASFRGTAPSHTRVTWNGMDINSPMLGMVDFSLVPSFLVDDVSLLHGTASSSAAGGGVGGAVVLGNRAPTGRGFEMSYTQGVGSFHTFDQFMRLAYGGGRFRETTRVLYATSRNDYRYTNRNKKIWHYGENGEITGWHHPTERNRNGAFGDLHIQQDFFYTGPRGDRLSLVAWWMSSRRGVPVLNTDYRPDNRSRADQNEQTLRTVAGWERERKGYRLHLRGGYTRSSLTYRDQIDTGAEEPIEKTDSRSLTNTLFGRAGADYYIDDRWHLAAEATIYGHFVESVDGAVLLPSGETGFGWDKSRAEASVSASVRWRPTTRLGFAANVREDLYGGRFSPPIPALLAEYTVARRGNVVVKASAARNFRYPTLNDMYFQPGGNPSLRPESGFTVDGGVSFGGDGGGGGGGKRRERGGDGKRRERGGDGGRESSAASDQKMAAGRRMEYGGEVTGYSSRIADWIMWRPVRGYWSPQNVALVHSYGVEARGNLSVPLGRGWLLRFDANYTLSKAINRGEPTGDRDRSVGKQLLYIPKHSVSGTAAVGWRGWSLTWKSVYYSRRYTTSDNDAASSPGSVAPYFMNDAAIEKRVALRWAGLSVKFAVNNLFDREYETVLARPMPGRNFGLYVEIAPKF
jgi:iron complex outermembrane receptor protein